MFDDALFFSDFQYRAGDQALKLYTELLNNRLCGKFVLNSSSFLFSSLLSNIFMKWLPSFTADVHTFNALIEATAFVPKEKFEDKWNNILVRKHAQFVSVPSTFITDNTCRGYNIHRTFRKQPLHAEVVGYLFSITC